MEDKSSLLSQEGGKVFAVHLIINLLMKVLGQVVVVVVVGVLRPLLLS